MGTALLTILLVACLNMQPVASGSAISTYTKNKTIQPCKDFYGYVCNKFAVGNSKQPPEGITVIKARVAKYLRQTVKTADSHLFKWAKMHFRACMDENTLNEIGVRPLVNIVNHATDFGWHILGESLENDWVPVHNSYSRLTGQAALLTVEVEPDENYKRNVISPTEDLFLRHVSKSNPEDISQYMDFLTDIWTAYANDQGHPTYSRKSVQNAIRDVLNFRQSIIEKRNLIQRNLRMTVTTLSNLQEHTRRIMENKKLNWPRFLQSMFQHFGNFKFNETNVVYIRQFNYVKIILRAIESAPVKVLLNHIHFHFWERFIQYTSVNMTARFYQMLKQPLPKRSIVCVSSNAMKKIVNLIYVKKFLTNYTISTARRVARHVREILIKEISRTIWIDRETARHAVLKLGDIQEEFGYDIWNIYQTDVISFYYYRMRISKNYLSNILDFETMSYRDALRRLWLPVPEGYNKYSTDPFEINAAAAYNYQTNALVIPPVLMKYIQVPLEKDFKKDVTYGAFGTIVGYSLSRALDSLGRQYDSNGNRRNWWGNATLTQYNERLECYLKRFQEASDKAGLNLNFTQVDGNDYSDEIVAEYIGLVAAHEANRKRKARMNFEVDVGAHMYATIDQIFFTAYVVRQCKSPIGIDASLPPGLRVNTALSNMQAFADAFQCKKNDPMYSSEKCQWLNDSPI